MPPKPHKPILKPKTASKVMKHVPAKTQGGVSGMELIESFMRDVSFESFLPPSLYPRENRDLDFHVAATVRALGKKSSCVNIAIRLRISPQKNPPFLIYEMIQEGVFNVPCENKEQAEVIYTQGGPQVYAIARIYALDILAKHGVKPPLPEGLNFAEMWQNSSSTN